MTSDGAQQFDERLRHLEEQLKSSINATQTPHDSHSEQQKFEAILVTMLDDIDTDKRIASIIDAGDELVEDMKTQLAEFCEEKRCEYESSILDRIEDKMKRGFQLALDEQRIKTVPVNIGVSATTAQGGQDDDNQSKTSRISSDPPTGQVEDPPPPQQTTAPTTKRTSQTPIRWEYLRMLHEEQRQGCNCMVRNGIQQIESERFPLY